MLQGSHVAYHTSLLSTGLKRIGTSTVKEKPMQSFFDGFFSPFKGIRYYLSHKQEFKKSFRISIFINILILVGIIALYIFGIGEGFESLLDWLKSTFIRTQVLKTQSKSSLF